MRRCGMRFAHVIDSSSVFSQIIESVFSSAHRVKKQNGSPAAIEKRRRTLPAYSTFFSKKQDEKQLGSFISYASFQFPAFC